MGKVGKCSRPRLWSLGTAAAFAALTTAAAPGPVAAEVRFPLTVDYESLRVAFRKHLHDVGGEVWRSADGCRTLALRDPVVEPTDGRLTISGQITVRAGLGFLGLCWAQLQWEGYAEVVSQPEVGPDWQLRLRDPDTRLYDANRQPSGIVPRVWDAVKAWAESEISAFTYDLGPPVTQVKTLLAAFMGPSRAAPLFRALDTIRPIGTTVEPDGLKVLLVMDLPLAPPTPRVPEPALTEAELKRWQARLESWDGFLVFVVKSLGVGDADPGVRDELLDILLTTRRDLVDIVGRGPESGVDPVRPLFLRTWNRLRALVRRGVAQRGDESRALRYAAFLSAGDALAALQAAAPAAGLDLSADGLRRLARVLDPTYAGDPVEYSERPDPTLRQIFRFRDPDAPPRRLRRAAPSGWQWLAPRAAYAEILDPGADEWFRLQERLNGWVPEPSELPAYRDTVAHLLTLAAERSFDPEEAGERFDDLFDHLVKAVAWQESCWRQFVRKDGAVTYLLSRSGDVGLMQINVRIWRGFFRPDRLRWSATYNAGAGAEILYELLLRYGRREAKERLENGARATYAAYNGGPARYRRYRTGRAPADAGFWEKYRAVAAGGAEDEVLCVPVRRAPS